MMAFFIEIGMDTGNVDMAKTMAEVFQRGDTNKDEKMVDIQGYGFQCFVCKAHIHNFKALKKHMVETHEMTNDDFNSLRTKLEEKKRNRAYIKGLNLKECKVNLRNKYN